MIKINHFNSPFSTYTKSAADDFENVLTKISKISLPSDAEFVYVGKGSNYVCSKDSPTDPSTVASDHYRKFDCFYDLWLMHNKQRVIMSNELWNHNKQLSNKQELSEDSALDYSTAYLSYRDNGL